MNGVLLINLGSPDSPHPRDVKRYLHQFLTDKHVIDSPWLLRQFLVRAVIVPKRHRESARLYSEIWTEEGAPLIIHGEKLKVELQKKLGENFRVELAMRYQNPSIKKGLEALKRAACSKMQNWIFRCSLLITGTDLMDVC